MGRTSFFSEKHGPERNIHASVVQGACGPRHPKTPGKVYITSLTFLRKSDFPPLTLKPGKPSSLTFKTVRFTYLTDYKRFSNAVLSLSFFFYFFG
jgi:hypothetical protein